MYLKRKVSPRTIWFSLLLAMVFFQGCATTQGSPKQMQKTNACLFMEGFVFASGINDGNGKANGNGMQLHTASWSGSGFVVKADGTMVTNFHVAQHALKGIAQFDDGAGTKVDLIGIKVYDPENDIAILKLKGDTYPTVPLGDSSTAVLTDPVRAVGNPHGIGLNITDGTISQIQKDVYAGDILRLVHTARIAPGNSGGALYHKGRVVGVNNATIYPSQVNFAIPINRVKPLLAHKKIYSFQEAFPPPVDHADFIKRFSAKVNNRMNRRGRVSPKNAWGTSAQFEHLKDYFIHLETEPGKDLELQIVDARTRKVIGLGTSNGNAEGVLITCENKKNVEINVVNLKNCPANFALSINTIDW